MNPSVLVFDLGKVLVDFDYSIAARRIAAGSKVPVNHIQFFIDQSPLLFRYELGQISTDEFFREICQLTGFSGTMDEFSEFFADIFTPIPPMLELHARLRRHGVPTYIFSNTNDLAVRHIRGRFPFFGEFDGYVLSYEHGAMKPDAKLYEAVENKTKRSGADILYIDDRPENVAAGSARGWRTVLHQSPVKTRAALTAMGW
jgi:HAD superfamily hydrolase (TIGR01509 family)